MLYKNPKGDCLFFDNGKLIGHTKYKTYDDCEETIQNMINLGVAGKQVNVYICKDCGMYHAGTLEHVEKYGK